MIKLSSCPFCGGVAGVKWEMKDKSMQSIGCLTLSMICPNPSLVVYKNENNEFDYTFWNRRDNHGNN